MIEQEDFGSLLAEKIAKTKEFQNEVDRIATQVIDNLVWDVASDLRIKAMKNLGLEFAEDDGMEFGMTCDGDLRLALLKAIAKEIWEF